VIPLALAEGISRRGIGAFAGNRADADYKKNDA
jgi:hypothetical protein